MIIWLNKCRVNAKWEEVGGVGEDRGKIEAELLLLFE